MNYKLEVGFEERDELKSLKTVLSEIPDQRKRRGVRYELWALLVLIVLAKLCGADTPTDIADWVAGRGAALKRALGLGWKRMPHHSTYRRVLQRGIDPRQLEQQVGQFLQSIGAAQAEGEGAAEREPAAAAPGERAGEEAKTELTERLLALDGKTLRGTIPTGQTQGLHLLSLYQVSTGRTWAQIEVGKKENEIKAAPGLSERVDLRGQIVAGDAMQAQHKLSEQVVQLGGDYLWVVKDNQPTMRAEIELLFTARASAAPSPADDFRRVTTLDKGHGRIEERTLTASTMLNHYLGWPHLGQVFEIKRETLIISRNKTRSETVYGLTSLTPEAASAKDLLALNRGYWGIENGSHHCRDVTFKEDDCRMKSYPAAESLAVCNNLAIGLIRQAGWGNAAAARRHYGARIGEALRLILRPPG
jgi:predicted transposase YbfD/YdcC